MERLSKEKRKEFLHNAIKLYESTYAILNMGEMFSRCLYEIRLEEILMKKYRIISCIKLMETFGMGECFKNMDLINVYDAYNAMLAIEEDEESFELLFEFVYNDLANLNEEFIRFCLQNTDWKGGLCDDLSDYDLFDEDIIKSISSIIGIHWNMSYNANADSEYLRSLGCEPYEYIDMNIEGNLVLTNKSVREMLDICSKHEEYRQWDEYKELSEIKEFTLFDRYYPDMSLTDLGKKDWKCISYILGSVAETEEEVSMPWLKYEAVLYLLLADMIAKDFLEHYHSMEVEVA